MSTARESIARTNHELMLAVRRGDSQAVAALYTPDAQLFPPESGPIQSASTIADFWKAVLGMGVSDIQLTTLEVEDHGSTAIETGEFTLFSAGGQAADRGKYVVVWKQLNGVWRLHRDIWNSSIARTAAKRQE